jgi:hypothetical protein
MKICELMYSMKINKMNSLDSKFESQILKYKLKSVKSRGNKTCGIL